MIRVTVTGSFAAWKQVECAVALAGAPGGARLGAGGAAGGGGDPTNQGGSRPASEKLTDGPATAVCPYKGLARFEASDAAFFFGRERLVAELVTHLVGVSLLGVVGPSGSGKSSLVRAGLLPALRDGVLPGSDHWRQVIMRPGEHPMRELDHATDALGAPAAGTVTAIASLSPWRLL